MNYSSKTTDIASIKTACLVVGLFKGSRGNEQLDQLNEASGGLIKRVLRKNDFTANCGATQMLYEVTGLMADRILLLGLGAAKDFNTSCYAKAVFKASKLLNEANLTESVFTTPQSDDLYAQTRDAVIAAEEAIYRFDQCKSDIKTQKRPLKRIAFHSDGRKSTTQINKACEHGLAIANGNKLAKDLSNLPGNICTPTYLADEAKKMGRSSRKLKVTILEEKDMQKLGMGSLLSVSRGSRQPAKFIIMDYKGGKKGSKPVVLVGKGLTFDAGGISIKSSPGMDEMKYDMCGGASVFGTLAACVEMQLPMNVIGVVPSSENMPDGDANKPGDIVTSMSGQTIEILNTDAEGRLILCDALTYTERFDPAAVIDIATLTGACIVALGHHTSGLMSNDDKLADDILAAGESSGDRAWRLPMWDIYQSSLDSNFADMANIGNRSAGTITAACFLSRYTQAYKWAHLDVAGTAWKSGAAKGATGRPVPLLTQFLMKRCKATD